MSSPQPSTARPKPRPTTGTARGRAQVPGALDPSGEIELVTGPAVADLVEPHTPGSKLPVSEFLFNRAGAASPFGDDLQFPLPSGALNYHR
jgi:succinate dehydrogenase / fumarate reductase iron-sulfur subunit